MEHYASTLATTALAVLGLVTGAHILHPRDAAVRTRPAMTGQAIQPVPAAWVDPPARVATARVAIASPIASPLDGAGLLVPHVTVTPPVGAQMVRPLPSAIAAPAERIRGAEAARRPRADRRAARARPAPAARTARAERPGPAPDPAPAPQAAARIDPIGDVIRGLGFGRDG